MFTFTQPLALSLGDTNISPLFAGYTVMALAVPGRETIAVEGVCEGRIAFGPRGASGFGYDPVFLAGVGDKAV